MASRIWIVMVEAVEFAGRMIHAAHECRVTRRQPLRLFPVVTFHQLTRATGPQSL
jgi:hypothetical protein